jgi:hypothetical protein
MHVSAMDEESNRFTQDLLHNIFDAGSDFWSRAPWMPRKDDIRKAFATLAGDDGDANVVQDGVAHDAMARLLVEATFYEGSSGRPLSLKSGVFQDKAGNALERPLFMSTEPLLQVSLISVRFTTQNL